MEAAGLAARSLSSCLLYMERIKQSQVLVLEAGNCVLSWSTFTLLIMLAFKKVALAVVVVTQ